MGNEEEFKPLRSDHYWDDFEDEIKKMNKKLRNIFMLPANAFRKEPLTMSEALNTRKAEK